MAAAKYLRYLTGKIQEVAATIVSAGVADDGKIVGLDASGKLDVSVLPSGVGPGTVVVEASEALSANNVVNFHNTGGFFRVRKADGTTTGKEVHGYVIAAYAVGALATVYLTGTPTVVVVGGNFGNPGNRTYLGTTAGQVTDTPPSASGNVVQYLGNSTGATSIAFNPNDGIILA